MSKIEQGQNGPFGRYQCDAVSDGIYGKREAKFAKVKTATGALALGAFLTACTAPDEGNAGDRRDTAQAAGTLPTGSVFRDLYMVAHEDDDLLFMNPDVPESIRSGHTVRTVYLTAGDAGATSAYWRDGREVGIREAYAAMAGAPNTWAFQTDTLNGKPIARFTLAANPRVSVMFLRLPDGGDGSGFPSPAGDTDCNRPGNRSLFKLWNDTLGTYSLPVLGTWSDCKTAGISYTKTELSAVLSRLVSGFAPTRMHIQDLSGLYGAEHSDHIHAARFAFVAHQADAAPHQLVVHRDYNINAETENLSPAQKAAKTQIFCTYAAHDAFIGSSGCATYGDGSPGSWLGSEYSSAEITSADGWLAGIGDKCLDLPGDNTTNGTALQISSCADVSSQKWTVSLGKIQLFGTNKCMDLRGADTSNGTPVQIWDCVDVPNQKWTLVSDGTLRGLNGKCLDVQDADSSDGTAVQLWDCAGQNAADGGLEIVPQQNWTIRYGVVGGRTADSLFSDSDLSGAYGTVSSYYGSIRLGDVNGDGLADLCGRRSDGVYCGLNQGNHRFAPATRYTEEFSDGRGWAPAQYGMTLMLGDVDGDGRADVCGRGAGGILCATANSLGLAFVPDFRVWTTAFSDATEFASGPPYYGSLRLVDVDGDGYADVCGRGVHGIECAINNHNRGFGAATTWLGSEYLDSLGWRAERYGMTIAFGDINGDGRVDVCGRGGSKIICATGNATRDGFENPRPWSLRSDFSDAAGWGASRSYYGSIRVADVDGDGYADVCGRSSTGLVCGLSSGNEFDRIRRILPQDYSDGLGWSDAKYGMTIQLADLDGDGVPDVCGRGKDAVLCSLAR